MIGGGYFGQDYFGGSPASQTEGGPSRTFVVNLDAAVAATGTMTQGTDAAIASITTSATMTARNTDATFIIRNTDASNLHWLVYP